MRCIHIHSVPNISLDLYQEWHMFLAHLVDKYPEYQQTAKECTGYKILDNSVVELGSSVDPEFLIDKVLEINANEVILPDIMGDALATQNLWKKNLPKFLDKIDWCKRMYVIHGNTYNEWVQAAEWAIQQPEIDVLGIPKIATDLCANGRLQLVRTLFDLDTRKEIHLLGLKYSVEEFNLWTHDERMLVRSYDTVMAEYTHQVNSTVRPVGWTIDLETGKVIHTK